MAAAALRSVMSPAYPMHLHASESALERLKDDLHLWDRATPLTMVPALNAILEARFGTAKAVGFYLQNATSEAPRFVWKLSSLLSSEFERTLFLDADLFVLWPAFVHSLLTGTLALGDLAMPIDVGRNFAPWSRTVAPPLCSAVTAYWTNRTDVVELLLGAAKRLIWHRHKSIRQGDQQMIWMEYVSVRTSLRVITLPEEYYCPQHAIKPARGGASTAAAAAASGNETRRVARPEWTNAWGEGHLWCKAVHSHSYTKEQIETLTAASRHQAW